MSFQFSFNNEIGKFGEHLAEVVFNLSSLVKRSFWVETCPLKTTDAVNSLGRTCSLTEANQLLICTSLKPLFSLFLGLGSTFVFFMYQSNRSFNIPPRQPPLGHLNFWKIFVQIPPTPGRKAVQMPPPPGRLPYYCFNFSVAVHVNMVYYTTHIYIL